MVSVGVAEVVVVLSLGVVAIAFAPLLHTLSPVLAIGPSELEFIKGYNFLICAVMWATAVATWLVKWRSDAIRTEAVAEH